MGRPPRVDVEGEWYHVIARGNGRQTVFHEEADFRRYLEELSKRVQRTQASLGAYTLMPNHVHLLLQRGSDELAVLMHDLQNTYGHWHNWKYARTGHVFEQRYWAARMTDDEYLCNAVRYIHQNALRAKLVAEVERYPWHSDGWYRRGDNNGVPLVSVPGFAGRAGRNRYCALIDVPVPPETMQLPERDPGGIERRKQGRKGDNTRERRGRPPIREAAAAFADNNLPLVKVEDLLSRKRKYVRSRHALIRQLSQEGYRPVHIAGLLGITTSAVFKVLNPP